MIFKIYDTYDDNVGDWELGMGIYDYDRKSLFLDEID